MTQQHFGFRPLHRVVKPKHYWLHTLWLDGRIENAKHFWTQRHAEVMTEAKANNAEIDVVMLIDGKCKDPDWAKPEEILYRSEPRHFTDSGKPSQESQLAKIARNVDWMRGRGSIWDDPGGAA